MIVASGTVLAFEGPSWYHISKVGKFFNSLHFWAVQLFFLFMVIHLLGKFWMAAWRGNRARTWITGMIALIVSIGAALTGYVIQTNFDSQWIAFEAKDGLNAVGIGAWFNVANALAACLIAHGLGLSRDAIASGLAGFQSSFDDNPGRVNIHDGHGFRVILDYAHNPAGLTALGDLVRSLRPRYGRVIGCVSVRCIVVAPATGRP